MKLSNPFNQETRNLFLDVYYCFNCSRSDRGLEGHHIVGRSSNSPLNFYPICTDCHSHANHSKEEESKYLQQTIRFLLRNGYKLTDDDVAFYKENRKLYTDM